MNKRKFFVGAALLALIALITQSVARGFLEDAMHRTAAAIAAARSERTVYRPDIRALQSSRVYNTLTIVGVVLTSFSVVCMVTALLRREPGYYLILILLLFFDIAVPMLL
jgi:hypothetical protein